MYTKVCKTKNIGFLSVFEKLIQKNGKNHTFFLYPGLRYAHKKLNLARKFFLEYVCLSA